MTTSETTQRAAEASIVQAGPSRPSDRLAALHRKAGESAILRDGRLEIAIDERGALRALVVGARELAV